MDEPIPLLFSISFFDCGLKLFKIEMTKFKFQKYIHKSRKGAENVDEKALPAS